MNVQNSKGKGALQEKAVMTFGSKAGLPPTSQTWTRERGPGNKKMVESARGRLKKLNNRPIRGLVFGPTKGEISLSESGKRLRVKNSEARRSGGVLRDRVEDGRYSFGQSGGIWLLWRDQACAITVLGSSDQYIHARVVFGTELMHIIAVYAAPTVSRRSGLWGQLKAVLENIDEPVLVGGDFNTIVRLDERTCGNGRLSPESLAFGEWINDSALARVRWQEAVVSHLPFLASDHTPLYVQLEPVRKANPRRRPFRFEAAWLKHDWFKELLVSSWNGEMSTPEALVSLKEKLKKWNKEIFGDVSMRKEKLLGEIKEIQEELESNPNDVLIAREAVLQKEFDIVLEQEERKRNRIEMLKGESGKWVEQSEELEKLAMDYYKRLYSTQDILMNTDKLPQQGFKDFKSDELEYLMKPFSAADMEVSARSMGESVARFGLEFFESGKLTEGMNDAMVVLIPKIITKAMVLRLKRLMPMLIGPAQASFIPGRLSTDNIVVVQEAVHSMRRKKGRKGWMLLKLDLEKAYDRIRWDFLEDTLYAAKLPQVWIKWIMECVMNPGMKRLCHQIESSVAKKEWKPIRLSRGGPSLSHICFADDLILFAEASIAQIRVIRKVLESLCGASGQKVSLENSLNYYSENVHSDLASAISHESGIKGTKDLGKYLGMPVLQKMINKETFGAVIEKVSSKLVGWKRRFLSLAGRITLTKSVLSSLPVHTMSTIALPASSLNQLNKIARSFIWGSTDGTRKQHLVSWERICKPKREGGLCIRLAKEMNVALLAKLG
ncbi:uncharacterized protein LOC106442870 [Brassica napus]|uniref:uncharacterized protein LOC106442870 n=1 Tax=Brassica napus TaxID=3708 RepID=UPI000BBF0CAF|nr:uncharacterized protein LOC106442870 [Brassica napus]